MCTSFWNLTFCMFIVVFVFFFLVFFHVCLLTSQNNWPHCNMTMQWMDNCISLVTVWLFIQLVLVIRRFYVYTAFKSFHWHFTKMFKTNQNPISIKETNGSRLEIVTKSRRFSGFTWEAATPSSHHQGFSEVILNLRLEKMNRIPYCDLHSVIQTKFIVIDMIQKGKKTSYFWIWTCNHCYYYYSKVQLHSKLSVDCYKTSTGTFILNFF